MEIKQNEQCSKCGHFANRGVSVDAIIIKNGQVLIIKRGVEPNKGEWGTPGGYVEWDESTEGALKREVKEETGLDVMSSKLVGVYSNPARHPKQTINIVYLTEVGEGELRPSDDAEEIRWVLLDQLPEKMALDHKQNILDAIKAKESL